MNAIARDNLHAYSFTFLHACTCMSTVVSLSLSNPVALFEMLIQPEREAKLAKPATENR